MLPPSQGAEELAPAIYATPLLAELKIKVCSISTEFKYKNVHFSCLAYRDVFGLPVKKNPLK
jgi:hypothetical protein